FAWFWRSWIPSSFMLFRVLLIAFVAALAFSGCASSDSPDTAGAAAWREQVAAVAAGQSDEIVMESYVATDADLAELQGLSNLRILTLEHSQVTDAGMAHLASLPNLQRLKIRGGAIGDDGVRRLVGLAELRTVNLPQARFTDEGLAALAELPH